MATTVVVVVVVVVLLSPCIFFLWYRTPDMIGKSSNSHEGNNISRELQNLFCREQVERRTKNVPAGGLPPSMGSGFI